MKNDVREVKTPMKKVLNLDIKDVEKFQKIIKKYTGTTVPNDTLVDIITKAYENNKTKLKDSHQAIVEFKFMYRGRLLPFEIAEKFAIPEKGISGRWSKTILPKLDRYIHAQLLAKTDKSYMDIKDIIDVCDLSARAIETIEYYGITNYRTLESFISNSKLDIYKKVAYTNCGQETYLELTNAIRYLDKYHSFIKEDIL